jgi:hypothetical protein
VSPAALPPSCRGACPGGFQFSDPTWEVAVEAGGEILLYLLALLRTNKAPLNSLFWAVLGARGIDAQNVKVHAPTSEKN